VLNLDDRPGRNARNEVLGKPEKKGIQAPAENLPVENLAETGVKCFQRPAVPGEASPLRGWGLADAGSG